MIYITAEISSHWKGDFHVLRKIAQTCRDFGIDAVKLQALSVEKLCRHPELSYYENSSVTPDNIDRIDRIMNQIGIEWYCTPTYADAVEFLDDYVNQYKISVAGWKDEELKERVLSTGKKVIVSSEKPLNLKDKRIKNLYCIPNYPTLYSEINFPALKMFDGYSNHCQNALAVLTAVEYGAKYIEFHMTPSKDLFLLDNKVAFNFMESLDMVRWIRRFECWYNSSGKDDECTISEQSFSQNKRKRGPPARTGLGNKP